MLVTQSYKTVTLSDDAYLHVQLAVLTQMKSDRAARRMPGDEYDKFLQQQLALGVEAMSALNAANVTVTAVMASNAARGTLADLDGTNLSTVIFALHFMLHSLNHGPFANVSDVLAGQIIASPDALNAALLFLENPK